MPSFSAACRGVSSVEEVIANIVYSVLYIFWLKRELPSKDASLHPVTAITRQRGVWMVPFPVAFPTFLGVVSAGVLVRLETITLEEM